MTITPDAWTDYPFVELGDEPGEEAPIRQISLLSYDGNKYVTVRLPGGQITSIKSGYCYTTVGRGGAAKSVPPSILAMLEPTP